MAKRAADLVKGDRFTFRNAPVTVITRKAWWDARTQRWVIKVAHKRGAIESIRYRADETVETF